MSSFPKVPPQGRKAWAERGVPTMKARVPLDLWQRITDAADARGESATRLLRRVVERGFEAENTTGRG